jgi:hypothetical protein
MSSRRAERALAEFSGFTRSAVRPSVREDLTGVVSGTRSGVGEGP